MVLFFILITGASVSSDQESDRYQQKAVGGCEIIHNMRESENIPPDEQRQSCKKYDQHSCTKRNPGNPV
jgi:hypothetical protein